MDDLATLQQKLDGLRAKRPALCDEWEGRIAAVRYENLTNAEDSPAASPALTTACAARPRSDGCSLPS